MSDYLRDDFKAECENAIKMYLKALEIDENFQQSRIHLGQVLSQIYQHQEALKHFNFAINNHNNHTDSIPQKKQLQFCYVERGLVYLMMEEERLNTSRNFNLFKQQQFDENNSKTNFIQHAAADFLEAIKLSQINSKDLIFAGDGKGDGYEWSKARICLAQARLRNGLRGDLNYIKEALQDFKLCETNTNIAESGEIFDGLGQCNQALKNYGDALLYYNDAINLQQNNSNYLMHRAQCYYAMGKFEECIKDYDSAILLN